MEKTAASGSGVPETDIELYTTGTPNGHKISIALEELGLRYSVRRMELRNNEQKEEWFLKINRGFFFFSLLSFFSFDYLFFGKKSDFFCFFFFGGFFFWQ